MKSLLLMFVLGFAAMAQAALPALPKGISAWAYDYNASIDTAIQSYQASAAASAQFRYFFPYCGYISIGPAGSQSFIRIEK